MKKFIKYFAILGLLVGFSSHATDNYKPRTPVEKVSRSLSMVEKKVRIKILIIIMVLQLFYLIDYLELDMTKNWISKYLNKNEIFIKVAL